MPSLVIGRVQPVNQGNYDATRAYVVLDRVKYQGAWYECQADAAAGTAPEVGGNAYWQEIGGKGADGLTPTPVWNGTALHFEYSDGTTTSAVDLKGAQGIQGVQGPAGPTPPLTSNLTSTAADVALSALGGKMLNDKITQAADSASAAQATADGKASTDLDDVTAAGKGVIAHAAMPGSQTISLSLPQSGGTVTAPADGYLMLQASGNSNNASNMYLYGRIQVRQIWTAGISYMFLPVSKDEVVTVGYVNMTGTPVLWFVYANGSAPAV